MSARLVIFPVMVTSALLTLSPLSLVAQEAPGAQSRALELAGAFTNDGYKIRDGQWSGDLEVGRPRFIEVNLFAGNEYWFCAAATSPARKLAVTVFDGSGHPVEAQFHADGATAAAGFDPETSGKYIVKLDLLEGEKAPFCFLYTYK